MKFNRKITPWRMDFELDAKEIPRWWFDDNPIVTRYANGLHLVFPEGERLFIRTRGNSPAYSTAGQLSYFFDGPGPAKTWIATSSASPLS